MNLLFMRPRSFTIHTDGAIRMDLGVSGLSAIVRNEQGQVIHLWSKRVERLTCNEAEYAAAIMALEKVSALRIGPRMLNLYSDSQVMVHQMTGVATARAPGLRQAQMRLRGLVALFERVSFHHIPREENRLADALANDAADGKENI